MQIELGAPQVGPGPIGNFHAVRHTVAPIAHAVRLEPAPYRFFNQPAFAYAGLARDGQYLSLAAQRSGNRAFDDRQLFLSPHYAPSAEQIAGDQSVFGGPFAFY